MHRAIIVVRCSESHVFVAPVKIVFPALLVRYAIAHSCLNSRVLALTINRLLIVVLVYCSIVLS